MSKLCCLHFYIRKRFKMNFTSFVRCSRNILNNLKNQPFKQTPHNFNKSSRCIQPVVINGKRNSHSFHSVTLLPSIGFVLGFSFFKSKEEEEETPEDKLIMTIKRSILSIQRKEYDKAEQLLHLALRMAQDIQHKDGVTYVYDVLANLAMERGQFKKAEKLFTDVMKRLFASGETEESLKILHISSKIAHMAHLQENLDKALQGFRWTLGKLEEQLKKLPDSEDIKEIKAITCDWFGQMLIEDQNYTEAKKCFQQAYDLFVERYGNTYSELVPLLNNLSVASLGLEDFKSAKEYLMQALELLKAIPDDSTEGLLQANLGLIYLRQGLIQQAKTTCSYAYKIGKKLKDKDSIDQACYCLDEVKKAMEA